MRFLVVGVGSMGKRRIRNLHELGMSELAAFDLRPDRLREAADKYGVVPFAGYDEAIEQFKPDAIVISTDPAHHLDYALPAADRGLPCFIEASVVDSNGIAQLANRAREKGVLMAPSCTMRYFPGPRMIKKLLREGTIGKPLNLNYQTGQYLPDWHPWEDIRDFYVSRRETGGCREIVPFELTWLNDLFGDPEPLACVKKKLTTMAADIDDVYHCLLYYPDGVLANITVEVISRPRATRELRILGSEGEIVYSADENCVRVSRLGEPEWVRFPLQSGTVESGYINPEEPYISELGDFVKAVSESRPDLFPNSLDDDVRVLRVLERLEQLSEQRA